jgi:hypothetical protein
MARLSTVLNTTELTTERVHAYWDALSDLPMDGVVGACAHLARYWSPTPVERFPVPATIRAAVRLYRDAQRALVATRPSGTLPAHTETSNDEALAHLHAILAMLEAKSAMPQGPRLRTLARTAAEHEALRASGQENPPDPTRWLPLREETDQHPHTPERSPYGK